jgi:hypothetical protein
MMPSSRGPQDCGRADIFKVVNPEGTLSEAAIAILADLLLQSLGPPLGSPPSLGNTNPSDHGDEDNSAQYLLRRSSIDMTHIEEPEPE